MKSLSPPFLTFFFPAQPTRFLLIDAVAKSATGDLVLLIAVTRFFLSCMSQSVEEL
jgi:hypothetical protein